jgi:hypothetical protein
MNHDSQRKRILRHMAQGKTITPLQALRLYGCLSLSQRCGELRNKERWPVESKFIQVGRSRVKQYWLPKARHA